jgi:hypothetical protein
LFAAAPEKSAEKLRLPTSGAKALSENKRLIAALNALRHPRPSFSADCEAAVGDQAIPLCLKA